MDWSNGFFTLLGVLVGVGITELRRWREYREKYRVLTFEKRLQAHQQAYYWCQKLIEVLNITRKSEDILKTAKEAREWWNGNCLFLDAKSRISMVRLTNASEMYADKLQRGAEVFRILDQTLKAIVVGIGAEYLPEMLKKPDEPKKMV